MIPTHAEKVIKAVAGVMAVIVVMSLVLVAFRVITWAFFWVIIIIGAFVAYLVLPYLKHRKW